MRDITGCETCSEERVLVGDQTDHRGERTDDVQPCHECATDPDFHDDDEAAYRFAFDYDGPGEHPMESQL